MKASTLVVGTLGAFLLASAAMAEPRLYNFETPEATAASASTPAIDPTDPATQPREPATAASDPAAAASDPATAASDPAAAPSKGDDDAEGAAPTADKAAAAEDDEDKDKKPADADAKTSATPPATGEESDGKS